MECALQIYRFLACLHIMECILLIDIYVWNVLCRYTGVLACLHINGMLRTHVFCILGFHLNVSVCVHLWQLRNCGEWHLFMLVRFCMIYDECKRTHNIRYVNAHDLARRVMAHIRYATYAEE